MPVFKAEQLRQMGLAIFQGAGASEGEAERVVELLVESNLIGHDSHGVIRISGTLHRYLAER